MAEESKAEEPLPVLFSQVTRDYFRTLGTELLDGREFLPEEDAITRPAAIINETTSRRLFGAANPLGRSLRFVEGMRPAMPIVGVVADSTFRHVHEGPTEFVYVPRPSRDNARVVRGVLLIRLMNPSLAPATISAARDMVRSVDAGVVVGEARLLHEYVDASLARERTAATLAGGIGLVALTLAAFGLYSTVTIITVQRTREIGVRMALGANKGRVAGVVLGEKMWLSGVGLLAGLFLGAILTWAVERVFVDLSPLTVLTAMFVAGVLALTSATAAVGPVLRALRIAPVSALKNE